MECYESEMAIRRAGIDTIKQCLGRYKSKEEFNGKSYLPLGRDRGVLV